MRYLYTLCAILWSLGGWGGMGRGGTSGGNGFFTKVNARFDFGLSLPAAWRCEGCDSRQMAPFGDEAWTLSAPGKATWMKVNFIKNETYTSSEALKADITAKFGNIWSAMTRGGFVGFISAPDDEGPNANDATEYYLVIEGKVIRIEWHKSKDEPEEALELNAIKRSINRVSAPPQIRYIRSESDKAYHVGDQACLLIGVKDLRGGMDAARLEEFAFEGQLPHWRRHTIDWDAERSQFRVCTKVTATFGTNGLQATFNINSEVTGDPGEEVVTPGVECKKNAGQLLCQSSSDAFGQGGVQTFPINIVPVDNPSPRLDGPRIIAVKVDPLQLTLRLDAESPEGIYLAMVKIGGKSQMIYPDELNNHKSVSIKLITHEGWNVIDEIMVFDRNGVPTVLRQPTAASSAKGASNVLYELVPWKGPVRTSETTILNFRKGGGFR